VEKEVEGGGGRWREVEGGGGRWDRTSKLAKPALTLAAPPVTDENIPDLSSAFFFSTYENKGGGIK